ncbi:MAG: NIPSNAP family protein [Alphaproteobacteria bacterium]|nr:NIPSNAP family protein [Alphaproteobacteria bacterium]
MILEIRTYTAAIGKAGQWLEHYGKHGLAVQQEMLGKLIFFGTTEVGPLNQIVHIWAYNSLAEREQKRSAMAKDPRWHEYLKNAPPGLLLSQESKILNPASFSPLK